MLGNLLNSNRNLLISSSVFFPLSILQTEWPCMYMHIHSTVLLDLLAAGMKFCEIFSQIWTIGICLPWYLSLLHLKSMVCDQEVLGQWSNKTVYIKINTLNSEKGYKFEVMIKHRTHSKNFNLIIISSLEECGQKV